MIAPQEKSRYFYSKSHHALSMMLDHGFRITNRNGVLLANVGIGLVLDYANREHVPLVYHPSDEPCYVHPDSLPLLEPIDGDAIHRTNGYHQMVGFNIGIPKAAIQIAAGGVIIQREGKPFHWPESEA